MRRADHGVGHHHADFRQADHHRTAGADRGQRNAFAEHIGVGWRDRGRRHLEHLRGCRQLVRYHAVLAVVTKVETEFGDVVIGAGNAAQFLLIPGEDRAVLVELAASFEAA